MLSGLIEIDVCEKANEPGVFKAMAFIGGTVVCTRYDRSEEEATLQALYSIKDKLLDELEQIDYAIADAELARIKEEEE